MDYIETFKSFLAATGADGDHTNGHVPEAGGGTCKGCNKSKEMLKLVAGKEMKNLFKHTGLVEDGDSFKQALDKIEQGIKKQTNQASARFKLFQQMPQAGRPMSKWFPEIKEQADRCDWTAYGSKEAARDSILFQCDDKKLMRKIMAEDLNFDDTVKIALAMEQGSNKVEEIRGKGFGKEDEKVARLNVTAGRQVEYRSMEEMVRAVKKYSNSLKKSKPKDKDNSKKCKACNFVHRDGQECPAKNRLSRS